MKKLISILAFSFLVGCAAYQPIPDLKASKNANSFQEDRQHCKCLLKKNLMRSMRLGMIENYYHVA